MLKNKVPHVYVFSCLSLCVCLEAGVGMWRMVKKLIFSLDNVITKTKSEVVFESRNGCMGRGQPKQG